MSAAIDKIASFVSVAPLSRSTLRRDTRHYVIKRSLAKLNRSIREWGYSWPYYNFRLRGRHPLQILSSPYDPAPGNTTLGSAILGGDMLHDGEQRVLDESFWQNLDKATPAFRRYAHSFQWLQDLAQVGDQIKARDTSETILSWWLAECEMWDREIWQAETLARRFINWASHAPLVLSSNNLVFRSKVLLSMARQLRHLNRCHGDTEDGLPQIYVGTALTLGGLLLPGGENWLIKGQQLLKSICKSFILADGGPASRNVADAIRTVQMLVLTRNTFVEVNADLPPWVQVTIDRLVPFIRALRHDDGSFAHIGGVSAEGVHGTAAILAASEASGKAIENAVHTGIQRVTNGASCLIIDAGPPAVYGLSTKAAAATSAFEFSSNNERIIVNMGPASAHGPLTELAELARSTAANSVLTISDTNSSKMLLDRHIGSGVSETQTTREVLKDAVAVTIIHNGYEKRYGVLHGRKLILSTTGRKLVGHDLLSGQSLKKLVGESIILRFHLHPGIQAFKAPDGRITLETKTGKNWIFDIDDNSATVEESLYLARPDDPKPCKQIVVEKKVKVAKSVTLHWTLSEITG
jgi:uncharacterized heparinase superfamily protein